MANPPKLDKLSSELENRLDELFGEDGPGPPASAARKAEETAGASGPAASMARKAALSPLAELKKIVLSIDWEITPEALDSFLDQVRLLNEVYRRDKVATLFLQVLGSLGHYIKSSRSQVHPSTFSVLNSVFARLDEVVSAPKMPEATRRKLLQAEMNAYQELRGKITRRRAAAAATQPARATQTAVQAPAPASGVVTPEMLARAVAELKELIRTEIETLRRLLKAGGRRE